ncbi:MAG: flagellar hook-length control protein FliK [Alphaproteobacteria bacterium]
MTAVYIPTVSTNAASPASKSNMRADSTQTVSDKGVSTTVDGLNAGSAEIFQNFFDIAFSQLTSAKRAGQIDVHRPAPQIEGQRPVITTSTNANANTNAGVNNLADFGRAFNFDPILNLTTNTTGAEILGTLDGAGQAELVEQLIGSLPADVIASAFEQFDIQAGIEGYDMPRSALSVVDPQAVTDVAATDDMHLYMTPVTPLQSLQGQQPTAPNMDAAVDTSQKQASPAMIATGLTPDQITQLSSPEDATIDTGAEASAMDVVIVTILPAQSTVAATQAQFGANAGLDNLKGIKDRNAGLNNGTTPLSSSDLKALKDMVDQLVPLDGTQQNTDKNSRNAQAQQNAQTHSASEGQLSTAAQKASHSAIPFSALVEDSGLETDLTIFTKENAATSANKDMPFIDAEVAARNEAGANAADKAKAGLGAAGQQTNAQQMAAKAQMMTSTSGLVPWDSLPEMSEMGLSADDVSLGQVLQNTPHTSPTLMHTSATMPHQATQTIAAKLTQNATQNGDTELQIELDPPELGRVKVHMIQDRDGGVKTHLSFDKPETFLMMQRDQAQLEKALADAGLDVGDGGLEFSLSSDNGGDNAQNGERQNGQSHSGSSSSDHADADAADEQNIMIETKMDWYTDSTGTLRLDMMA